MGQFSVEKPALKGQFSVEINTLQVMTTVPPANPSRFSLQVVKKTSPTTSTVVESYYNLSINPSDPNYVVSIINNESQYLTFLSPTSTQPAAPSANPTSNAVPAPQLSSISPAAGGTLPAGPYFYQVSALYGAVESLPSNELSLTTTAAGGIALSWTAPVFQGQSPTGYRIYRASAAGTESGFVLSSSTAATFTDTGSPLTTGKPLAPQMLSGGSDGTVLTPTDGNFETALNLGGAPGAPGLHLLDRVPIFNLLCVPGESDAATIQSLQSYCSTQRAFYIVDSPLAATTPKLIASGPIGTTSGQLDPSTSLSGPNSTNAAYYYPWVSAPDPLAGNRPRLFPPSGFVAGVYAASDAAFGVWTAPAGINAGLTGVSGLQTVLNDAENGSLNPQAVNCLRQFRLPGNVLWGARTLQGADQAGSQWKYVPIRRLALYIESSLYEGTQWVVFQPNNDRLWSQIRLNVGTFMQQLFLQGAFQGTTPSQAYFVKCDAENNPQASIDQGIVTVLVGFAPLYPAEFVVIQIQQITDLSQP